MSATPDPQQFVAEAQHELSSALEELSAASKELRQQNDELIATRHHVEIERRRYLGLFDFAPDGYLITTMEGVIREANRAAAGLLNVAAEALAGNPLVVFVAEGDRARFHSEIIDLQRGIESHTFELHLQPRERAPVPAAIQVIVNPAPNMQSPTLHWLVQDITERRRAEQQLKEATEHFELIFNINPDAAQITRLSDGCIVDINESVTAMSGFTRQDMIGKSTLDIDLWDSPADRQIVIAALREQGYCKNYETVFKRKDGSRFPCLLSARLYTYQGEPHVITISRDITDRKQIEEALRASEEKFRSVIEQASEAIVLFDEESRCVEVNLALERLTGVPRAEWLGLTAWEINLRFMPEDQRTPDAEARFKAHTQALAAGQAAEFALAQEFALCLPNGEIRNVRMTIFPIQMARSSLLGSILFDITERKLSRRTNPETEL